ncbi:hypothetical protein LEP1GSC170_3964 [Leptospira interrogans serovar Bataviae str. HAI135]|nr:hypothetical protein LEP1GSC170_3964 [Leptospira interrogans serovar Bataviae str. HAI135]
MYDVERPTIGKLYNRFGAVDSKSHPYKIYFPGYGKIKMENLYLQNGLSKCLIFLKLLQN